MYQYQINTILKHYTDIFDINFFPEIDKIENLKYENTVQNFISELKSQGEKFGVLIVENEIDSYSLAKIIKDNDFPIVYFNENEDGTFTPIIDGREAKKGIDYSLELASDGTTKNFDTTERKLSEKVKILTAFPLESISKEYREVEQSNKHLTPMQRLIRMLKVEKKDIISIYVYALLIGAVSLMLPLGIQAIVGMVQGGLVFSSIYVLIGLVVVALIISGVMQIMQLTLVEYLQERLFAKAAFDFTFRIPRIKAESLFKYYPPELLNRFFDIITIQKTLPKILIDITAAVIQIIFGLLLLAAYHPLFIGLTFVTVLLFYVVTRFYGSTTLDANIVKSKYKYKIAQWLQDVARLNYSFKVSGSNGFPLEKTQKLVSGYLRYRKKYFDSLLIIFYNAVFFKVFITGGLLILGTYLVIDRQITIGQFVASEIIVVLVVSSIEKILLSIDSVFDLLTAVDKLGYITDLPLEPNNGVVKHLKFSAAPISLQTKDLIFKYDDLGSPTINQLNLVINANENICLAGANASGKETLLNVLAGIYTSYKGSIMYNGISLRDIERDHFYEMIERNVSAEDVFDGTLLENLTMNRPSVTIEDVYWVLENLNLLGTIAELKDGLNTQMISGGRRFSNSFITKLTLARCIVNRPKLLMLSNCYENFDSQYMKKFLSFVTDKEQPWTLLTISNDSNVMKACDKVIILDKGKIVAEGTYDSLEGNEFLSRCIK
jgi:ABC-type bacteriocin/lantibiotic exporter with double-glycine peptidase domain